MNPLYKDVHGDSTLYAGMLAYLGDQEAAEYVSQCVDANGQVWRNPEAAREGFQYRNSSSRDMLMGVLLANQPDTTRNVIDYLRRSKGLLCPEATDGRKRAGIMSFAYLALVHGKISLSLFGLRGALFALIGKPIMGLITLIEALTVYEKYQLNLVFCQLMLLRRYGGTRLDKAIMWVLTHLRRCDEVPFYFLQGDASQLEMMAATARHNRQRMLANPYQEVAHWPSNNGWLGHAYPPEIYCVWLVKAAKYLRRKESANL